MLDNCKIEANQFQKLIALYIIGDAILFVPTMLTSEAKQDAWIAAIIGILVGLLLAWMYKTLASFFSNMTLVEYTREIFGQWLGTFISFLFFAFVFLRAAIILRHIGDFLTSTMMPETPILAFSILFIIIVMMGVRYGLDNIGRTAEIFFPWIMLSFIIFVLFLLSQVEFHNLQPILEKGIKPVLHAAYLNIGFPFLELVFFLMLFPYVTQIKEGGKAFIRGTLIGGIVLIIIALLSILVLGEESTGSEIFSSFELAKKINVGNFIQRLEVIMAIIWIISTFFKLIISFYVSAICLAQLFRLTGYRSLSLPLGMILVVLSLIISPNLSYLINFEEKIWTQLALSFGFFLPLLLMGVYFLKKKLRT